MYLLAVVLCCLSFSTTSHSLNCYKCSKHTEVHCDIKSITDGRRVFVTCHHLNDSSCPSTQAAVGQMFCFVNIKFSGIDWLFMATSSKESHDNSPYNQTRQTCKTFEFVDNGSTGSLSPVGGLCSCTTSNCNALGNYTITLNRNFSVSLLTTSPSTRSVIVSYSTTTDPTGGQDIKKEGMLVVIKLLNDCLMSLFLCV